MQTQDLNAPRGFGQGGLLVKGLKEEARTPNSARRLKATAHKVVVRGTMAAPMKTLEEYIALAGQSHGHMCPGQILGIRMAMLGLRSIGIDDPVVARKRLLTFVEIDRCATDAVSLVTGCRLGKRSLKFLDYGKVAATFVDLETGRAVRVAARDDARARAKAMFPDAADAHLAQLAAYRTMENHDLFDLQTVRVKMKPEDLPGRPHVRVACAQCGEGVNDGREVRVGDRLLCRSCAGEKYYDEVTSEK